jgi:hypothetical protein
MQASQKYTGCFAHAVGARCASPPWLGSPKQPAWRRAAAKDCE